MNNITNAQIKVFNTDQVQVGPLLWSSFPSTSQLFVNGGLEVRESPGTGMYIKNYNNVYNGTTYNDPSIVSHFNYGGWVGKPSQAMFAVYTNQLYVLGVQITSDERLKTNIKKILSSTALSKILSINSYTYDYNDGILVNTEEKKRDLILKSGKNQIGFMAQELKDIIPEAVKQDSSGTYSVNYIMILPMLVEAMKEQQNKISELEKQLLELRK
ncbi:MAG: tail fiber domain-containing protein [Bacteroidetes bacterium]|nr:tail fiber domain-containing protein [Bacteroidota bacterium]